MDNGTRVPTIDDLRVRLCWICREEETHGSGEVAAANRRTWVHPCSCTLIAHEDCLLEWVKEAQRQPSRIESALKCPQCGTKYIIKSQSSLLLRALNTIDKTLTTGGTFVTLGLTAGLGVAFAGSVYGLCLYYGANAVRVFVGNRMYELIVGNDPNEWTWPVYWNLPLIPFYLIVSHIGPRLENLLLTPIRLPILFSLLFPPPSALAVTHQAIDLPTFLLSFPPTPALCALLYPWIRTWYTSLRTRLTRYVLGLGPDAVPRNQRQGIVVDNNANNNAVEAEGGILGADFRIILDLQDGNAQGEMGGPAAPAAGDNAAGNNQNVANALPQNDRRHLRLTFSSFGRFLASALLQPWVAALSGKALELLSKRWRFLRVLLAMDIPQTPRPGWLSNIIQDSPQWRNLSSGMVWYPPWPLQPMDSIWWRNTVGLSLWVIARDAVSLLHIFLRKRELQSRRILSRSFAGVDIGTLDLISPVTF